MKLTFIFLAVFCAVVAHQSRTQDDDDVAYENFKRKHGKRYGRSEESERKEAYLRCRDKIISHNRNFTLGLVSYRMRENKQCDLLESERQKLSNGIRVPDYEFTNYTVRGKTVGTVNNTRFPPGPPSFSWVTQGCVGPVKDQGFYCDDCWAFSGIAALESAWCIKTGNLLRLSEQQLIDCNRNPTTGNWGCDGGSQSSAYMYIYGNNGIQNDTTYPYQEDVPHVGIYPCRSNLTKKVATDSGYWRIRPGNETLLRDVIAAKGPVAAALYGSLDSFYYYWDGIYDDPSCPSGTTHSLLIVGYGTENGVDYWLCKNSWSVDWGDYGYVKIRRGVNRCGITVYLIYPDV